MDHFTGQRLIDASWSVTHETSQIWKRHKKRLLEATGRRSAKPGHVLVSGVPSAPCECSLGDGLPSTSESRCGRSLGGSLQSCRSVANLGARRGQFDLRKSEHRVPERKASPAARAVAHGAGILNAFPEAFLAAVESAGDQATPLPDRALSATETSAVDVAGMRRRSRQALQQTLGRAGQSLSDVLVAHVEL